MRRLIIQPIVGLFRALRAAHALQCRRCGSALGHLSGAPSRTKRAASGGTRSHRDVSRSLRQYPRRRRSAAVRREGIPGVFALRLAGRRIRAIPLRRLRHRRTDGTTHLLFHSLELLERLVVITPRPRINLILYHGVLPFDLAQGTLSTVEGWRPAQPGGGGLWQRPPRARPASTVRTRAERIAKVGRPMVAHISIRQNHRPGRGPR